MLLKKSSFVAVAAALTFALASCGDAETDSGDDNNAGDSTTEETACDSAEEGTELAKVCDAGTLTVSTDPAYPPQSSLNEGTGEYEGFDIDVATEIANRLGVEVAWEAPPWDAITAGSWNGRWDMTVGSMTPTNERQEVINFTEPYYYGVAVAVVNEDNSDIQDLSTDLDGKKIGVCSACTYEAFLNKDLNIEGFEFDFVVDDADVVGYDTDTSALQDLALGDGTRLDAVLTSLTTANGFIDSGKPVKVVGDPLFYEPMSVGFDRSAAEDSTSLRDAVNDIVLGVHEDGTLSEFSNEWYGVDLTKAEE
jgi:polar amino acid transport system substrate-binding protein